MFEWEPQTPNQTEAAYYNHTACALSRALVFATKCFSDQEIAFDESVVAKDAFAYISSLEANVCYRGFRHQSEAVLSSMGNLFDNLDHWKVTDAGSKLYYFLAHWLKGLQPPPRCRGVIDGPPCMEQASSKDIPFCNLLHRCTSREADCARQRAPHVSFCAEHRCHADNCTAEALDGQNFCNRHLCVGCLQHTTYEKAN